MRISKHFSIEATVRQVARSALLVEPYIERQLFAQQFPNAHMIVICPRAGAIKTLQYLQEAR